MKKFTIFIALAMILSLTACKNKSLPLPEAGDDKFGVDKNINIDTIDEYLGRDDVVLRDVRMLIDPGNYEAIGGEGDLTKTIKGFKIVPLPYLLNLAPIPIDNLYEGKTLFDVEWGEGVEILSVKENYVESMMLLEELFPKDKPIFIMCGGAGYAGMTVSFLKFLGWDEDLLYNIGAGWFYEGENAVELVKFAEDANDANIYASWRADYAYWDFSLMSEIE